MTAPSAKTCYTIGYGNSPSDDFVKRLAGAGIDVVIDVRSVPYSKFNPDFKRGPLEKILENNSIAYRYLGDRIGGKLLDPGLLRPDGSADYKKIQATEKFRAGVDEVIAIVSSGTMVALMCAEMEPERCHRFALISPVLQAAGVSVVHILSSGQLLPNPDLERMMVDRLFDRSQARLSDEPLDYVAEMYERVSERMLNGKSK